MLALLEEGEKGEEGKEGDEKGGMNEEEKEEEEEEEEEEESEWVGVMRKHRVLAGKLEVLASNAGGRAVPADRTALPPNVTS